MNGKAYKQQELLDVGKYRVLRVGNFNTNDKWYYSNLELDENKYANSGDLLYLWATSFGPEIWNEEKVIYHYHIWKLEVTDNSIDKHYLYTWLLTDKERIKQSTNGSTMIHITKGSMEEREFQFPVDITEQKKIGSFFQKLDDTLALHQRKLEQLKRLKQGFLQVLFANEVDVPKVRFAGFTEEWEQRKLGSLVEFYSGLTYSPDNITNENGTFVLRSSNVKGGEIVNADNVYVDSAVVNSDNVKVGDIIVVVRNGSRELIGKHAQIKDNMNDTVIGAFMTGIRCQESNFTNALLDTKQFKMEINKNLGATINQITIGSFKKMIFCVTINKKEQLKIGAFFKQLDDTLTLHQNKISQLKKLKKAFLQKMFI